MNCQCSSARVIEKEKATGKLFEMDLVSYDVNIRISKKINTRIPVEFA